MDPWGGRRNPWLVWVALHTPRHSNRSALWRHLLPLFGLYAVVARRPAHRLWVGNTSFGIERNGGQPASLRFQLNSLDWEPFFSIGSIGLTDWVAAAETMPAYSRGSILGVLMHLAGAARTSAMGVAGIGVQMAWRGPVCIVHSVTVLSWNEGWRLLSSVHSGCWWRMVVMASLGCSLHAGLACRWVPLPHGECPWWPMRCWDQCPHRLIAWYGWRDGLHLLGSCPSGADLIASCLQLLPDRWHASLAFTPRGVHAGRLTRLIHLGGAALR